MPPTADEPLSIEMPRAAAERLWTPPRIVAALAITAALAGEATWALTREDPLSERRAAVAALPESEKAELVAKAERFAKLPPAERDRLRALAADLDVAGTSDAWRKRLDAYLQWKSRLTPQQSASLIGLDARPRFERVDQIVAEFWTDRLTEPTDADAKVIVAWLEKQVRENQDKLLENLPGSVRDRFHLMGSRERTWALMYYMLSGGRGPGSGPSRLDAVAPQALLSLRAQLSPAAQARWDAAVKRPPGPDDLKSLVAGWIRTSIERTIGARADAAMPAMRIDEHDLRAFFETELTEPERQRFLAMTRDEMDSQLRREYLRRKGLWKEPSGTRFGPFPRPFGSGDQRRRPNEMPRLPNDRAPDNFPEPNRRPPGNKRPGGTIGSVDGIDPRRDDDRRTPATTDYAGYSFVQ